LGACADIPDDGPVVAGGAHSAGRGSVLRALVAGPVPDDPPRKIVQGFVRSMVGVTGEFAVARTFMSKELAKTWGADATTVVFTGAARVSILTEGADASSGRIADEIQQVSAEIEVSQIAEVNANGDFVGRQRTTTVPVTLVRIQGQWRVSEAPSVVLLSVSDFRLSYRSSPMYLLTTDGQYLNPVTKWFPDTAAAPTRLVRELLAGPPEWIAPAVTTAIPEGTSLVPPASVTMNDGEAVVELTGPVLDVSPAQRANVVAQVRATVTGVLPASRVRILVDGARLEVAAGQAMPAEIPTTSGAAVLLRQGRLVRYELETLNPIDGLPDLSDAAASHPAASRVSQHYAVLTQDRDNLTVLAPGEDATTVLAGDRLTPPSFDRLGWIWTGDRTGAVRAALPDGSTAEVRADWLKGRTITSLRICADGTRVAVVSHVPAPEGLPAGQARPQARVDIGVVRRDADRPAELIRWQDNGLDPRLRDAVEAQWIAPERLVVLSAGPGPLLRQVPLRALMGEPMGTLPAGVTAIAGGDLGTRSVLAFDSGGTTYAQAGRVWLELPALDGATDPAYPG
ncbi:MAG: hypothetical protein CSB46_07115, partial [Micrococcales bacterium]